MSASTRTPRGAVRVLATDDEADAGWLPPDSAPLHPVPSSARQHATAGTAPTRKPTATTSEGADSNEGTEDLAWRVRPSSRLAADKGPAARLVSHSGTDAAMDQCRATQASWSPDRAGGTPTGAVGRQFGVV